MGWRGKDAQQCVCMCVCVHCVYINFVCVCVFVCVYVCLPYFLGRGLNKGAVCFIHRSVRFRTGACASDFHCISPRATPIGREGAPQPRRHNVL